jgi:2-amino-4-hydroxy-6-hydroxymethyldihydropteridine diphosphokinase
MAKKKKKVVKKSKKKTVKKKVSVKPKKSKLKGKKRKKGETIAYLSLGSNVGDREEYLEQAVFLLGKHPKVEVLKRSNSMETEAEVEVEGGKGSQPLFINCALEVKTKLSPQQLLDFCNEIEVALGREREIEWGPRTIDIDILLYNDDIVSEEKLQIPHPLMHERIFVLKPLSEIAPKLLHPILEKNISTLFEEKKAEVGETYDDELPGFREIKGGVPDDYERW